MKNFVALVTLLMGLNSFASTIPVESDFQRCIDNCMVVMKDEEICNFKCEIMRPFNEHTKSEIIPVDAQCFEELMHEVNTEQAIQEAKTVCLSYDFEQEIDYDSLID